MQRRKRSHQRQPQPEAPLGAVGAARALHEHLEHLRQEGRVDAFSVVAYAEDDFVAIARGRHFGASPLGCVACGVGEEVVDDLGEADLVRVHREPLGGDGQVKLEPPLLDERPCCLDRLRDHTRELERNSRERDLSARHARDVEQVIDEAHEVLGLPQDHLALVRRGHVASQLHELDRREDGRERVPELVRQERQELVLPTVGLAHRSLRLLESRHVHEGPDRPPRRAARIAQWDGAAVKVNGLSVVEADFLFVVPHFDAACCAL